MLIAFLIKFDYVYEHFVPDYIYEHFVPTLPLKKKKRR